VPILIPTPTPHEMNALGLNYEVPDQSTSVANLAPAATFPILPALSTLPVFMPTSVSVPVPASVPAPVSAPTPASLYDLFDPALAAYNTSSSWELPGCVSQDMLLWQSTYPYSDIFSPSLFDTASFPLLV
jgi:hypothetical protein